MALYKITDRHGANHGTHPGDSPEAALDTMARDEGYRSWTYLCEMYGEDWSAWTADPLEFRQDLNKRILVRIVE